MKKLSKVICLVLSALMLLSLAACGKQAGGADDAQGKPIEGGTFVYAIEEPITSLNWYNNSSTDLGKQVFQNLYDPMWKSNTDGSLDYRLAKSVDISEDGATYTLTLRDDIYWSDGEKITTDDIVFTLDNVSGGGGGGEYGAGAVHPPPAPLHQGPHRRHPHSRSQGGTGPPPQRAARTGPQSRGPASRLPVRRALPLRHRPLPGGEAGALRHGRWPPGGLPSVPVTAVVSHFPMKRRHPSFFVVLPVPTGAV